MMLFLYFKKIIINIWQGNPIKGKDGLLTDNPFIARASNSINAFGADL